MERKEPLFGIQWIVRTDRASFGPFDTVTQAEAWIRTSAMAEMHDATEERIEWLISPEPTGSLAIREASE